MIGQRRLKRGFALLDYIGVKAENRRRPIAFLLPEFLSALRVDDNQLDRCHDLDTRRFANAVDRRNGRRATNQWNGDKEEQDEILSFLEY